MPSLGIPTDNSLLEGQALLERAAKIRALRSSTQFREKDKQMDELTRENTQTKTDENRDISIELKNKMEVQELADIDSDGWRRTVVDSVRYASGEIDRKYEDDNVYDLAEGREARRIVDQKTTEIDEANRVRHEVYAENTEKVKRSASVKW